jgi:hypothetical protein
MRDAAVDGEGDATAAPALDDGRPSGAQGTLKAADFAGAARPRLFRISALAVFGFCFMGLCCPVRPNGVQVMPKVPKDRLGRIWDTFLRLGPGERHQFLLLLRDWHLERRIEAVASRGGHYASGTRSFAGMTLDGADLEPPAKPAPSAMDLSLENIEW